MNGLLNVPIAAITALTAEEAVTVIRSTLRAECRYGCVSPASLTISDRLTVADGGIDAEVNVTGGLDVPADCLFQLGLTGFQIKSGTSFKPWTKSAIRGELLNSQGNLYNEVQRLVRRGGRYVVICTGHDLTPEQRNEARDQIASVLTEIGYSGYADRIDVFGASQLATFIERYGIDFCMGTTSAMSNRRAKLTVLLSTWHCSVDSALKTRLGMRRAISPV